MLFKFVSAAAFAVMILPNVAFSQTIAQIGGPAEQPPSGYAGDQFVDSRGCVFLRAGIAGQARWVPRVSRDRKVLCGFPPTFGARVAIEMADESPRVEAPRVAAVAPVAPAPRAVTQAPMATIASAMMPPVVAAPVARPQAAAPAPQTYQVVTSTGPGAGKIGCYSNAPVAEVVQLRNGGTAVVCTRGDGTLAGWRPPVYPNGSGVGAALRDPVVARADISRPDPSRAGRVATAGSHDVAQVPAARHDTPAVPKGYKLAWTDDRLNPNRGVGTAKGQQAQDQVWNRDVPATLVGKTKAKSQVTVSTKNAPTAPVQAGGSGKIYVQVGTFGVAANAAGAAQRLRGLGLPVAKSKISKGGKALEIVLAGPFGSTAAAQGALRQARGAGFGDAFLR